MSKSPPADARLNEIEARSQRFREWLDRDVPMPLSEAERAAVLTRDSPRLLQQADCTLSDLDYLLDIARSLQTERDALTNTLADAVGLQVETDRARVEAERARDAAMARAGAAIVGGARVLEWLAAAERTITEMKQDAEGREWKAYRTGWLDGAYRSNKADDGYERLSAEADHFARLYCDNKLHPDYAARAVVSPETET